jgi:putative sporulation protein YtaF
MYYVLQRGQQRVEFWSSFLLAAAVSIDGLGAGFAYGVRNLYVPFLSLIIVSLSSSLALLAAMLAGRTMASFFSPQFSSLAGGAILALVGCYIIWSAAAGEPPPRDPPKPGPSLWKLIREPETADFDSSGSISSREAAVLGLALAMDAFGAGFGAAMTGYSPLVTCLLVGLCKFLFISGGVSLGKRYAGSLDGGKASWLAGGVLIILGVINII